MPTACTSPPAIRSAIISSVAAQWPVRTITAPAIAGKAPNTFSPGAMITGSPRQWTRATRTTFRTASGSSGQRRRGKELRGELTEHEFVMQIVAGVASRRVSAPLRISEHLVTATSIRPFSHRNVNSSFRMRRGQGKRSYSPVIVTTSVFGILPLGIALLRT